MKLKLQRDTELNLPRKKINKYKIIMAENWIPFNPQVFAPMAENLLNEEDAIFNPPANDWSAQRKNAIRTALGLDGDQRGMQIVDLIIASFMRGYEQRAMMTNAEMVELGWLLFHQQAITRIINLEDGLAQVHARLTTLEENAATILAIVQRIQQQLPPPPTPEAQPLAAEQEVPVAEQEVPTAEQEVPALQEVPAAVQEANASEIVA